VTYDLPTLFAGARDLDLFYQTEAPDAFMHEQPNYVTWSPQIHRAPASS
jgi:tRNA threonylcarbamoyladenosine biosynthesis protein TsaB